MGPALSIFLCSTAALFQELTLIRWLPGQVRAVAYFPNLVLIAAFLGLGAGALLAERRKLLHLWGPLLLLLILTAALFGRCIIYNEMANEHLWLLYYDLPPDAPKIQGIFWPILLIFFLTALSFIPLGQLLAVQLNRFKESNKILLGYCWDILGSLTGVVLFSVLSYAGIFPIYWFIVLTVCAAVLFSRLLKPSQLLLQIAAAIGCVVIVNQVERAAFYSPYYAVGIREIAPKQIYTVLTNGSLHQRAQSMGLADPLPDNEQDAAYSSLMREGYHRPYRYHSQKPKRVLVIGAGNGNDVAVALQQGAEEVHAVEIDPVIIEIGKRLHPNQPYSSPKVKIFNDDARSYLNNSAEMYDLIVFATLDSMTKLSALSNVRLDNFVYTQECIQAARKRLNPEGGLVMHFRLENKAIRLKLMGMLANQFDHLYRIEKSYTMFNITFLAGEAFKEITIEEPDLVKIHIGRARSEAAKLNIPTDDWPYLYLTERTIGSFYIKVIAGIFLIAIALIGISAINPIKGISQIHRVRPDWEMTLLGMGFLLFEGRAVTSMSLLFGATWLTSAVVFGAILVTILASTLMCHKIKVSRTLGYIALFLTLVAFYYVPATTLLQVEGITRVLVSALLIGAPVFFASICFAVAFSVRNDPRSAFGWNLIGAVCGGLFEFLTMTLGFQAMILIAIVIYLLAFVAGRSQIKLSTSAL